MGGNDDRNVVVYVAFGLFIFLEKSPIMCWNKLGAIRRETALERDRVLRVTNVLP